MAESIRDMQPSELERMAEAHGLEPRARSIFAMGKKVPLPILDNIIVALGEPGWAGLIAQDEMSGQIMVMEPTPAHVGAGVGGKYPRQWGDSDDAIVTAWMQSVHMLYIRPSQMRDAVLVMAKRHAFHPLRQYLDRLVWDLTPRLDIWLQRYLGADDTKLTSAFGRKFMISAVLRAYEPGAKVDHMLILESEQGARKSSALEALCPWPELFTDDLGDSLGKDAAERIAGKWIVEVAELDSMSRHEVTRIKSFITRKSDRFRAAYGKWAADYPRQCVFAGSTNADAYLKDETGGRRFWPIRVGAVDLDALRADRDQLWAEAVTRYLLCEPHWLEADDLVTAARHEQSERYQEDIWHERIASFIDGRSAVSVAEILTHLGVDTSRQGQTEMNRVAKTLRHLGWVRHQVRVDGRRAWVYRSGVGASVVTQKT